MHKYKCTLNDVKPQGGTLKFNTYVGLGYFVVGKILNFNIILGFQKKKYFWV